MRKDTIELSICSSGDLDGRTCLKFQSNLPLMQVRQPKSCVGRGYGRTRLGTELSTLPYETSAQAEGHDMENASASNLGTLDAFGNPSHDKTRVQVMGTFRPSLSRRPPASTIPSDCDENTISVTESARYSGSILRNA
jgi:hypothetical protein